MSGSCFMLFTGYGIELFTGYGMKQMSGFCFL